MAQNTQMSSSYMLASSNVRVRVREMNNITNLSGSYSNDCLKSQRKVSKYAMKRSG